MKQHRNIRVWYITTFLSYSAFLLPVWVIFNTEYLGLNNTQAFLIGVLPYGLSAFFEVPTGAWADRYGRKKIYLIGTLLYGLSVLSLALFKDFWVLLPLQMAGAVGLAMQSGCIEALVHDSLDAKDKDAVFAKVSSRKQSLLFLSRILTVLLSGFLYAKDPRFPVYASTIMNALGLVSALWFVEVRIEKPLVESNIEQIKQTFKVMLRKHGMKLFLCFAALHAFISEGLFALYQPHLKSIDVSISNFGLYFAVISTFSALGALSSAAALRKYSAFSILFALTASCTFGFITLLSGNVYLFFAGLVPSSIAFGYITVTINTYVTSKVTSAYQATALSIASFIRTVSLFLVVVLIGVLLDVFALQTVITTLLVFSIAVLAGYMFFNPFQRKVSEKT